MAFKKALVTGWVVCKGLALVKRGAYCKLGTRHDVLRLAGICVIVLHALLTAFVPQELLLLTGHDHVIQGTLTREEWQEHLKFHLQQAKDLLDGAHTTESHHAAEKSKVISITAAEVGIHNTTSPALALLPSGSIRAGFVPGRDEAVLCLCAQDLSPALDVPHLPPSDPAPLSLE
jgi:hypothetical protein